MEKVVILSNTATLVLTLIALFAIIFSYIIQNKTVACVIQVISFACVLATVTYALLLGASLTEILVYVLIFVLLNAIAFVPDIKKGKDVTRIETDGGKEQNGKTQDTPDSDGSVQDKQSVQADTEERADSTQLNGEENGNEL